MGHLRHRNFQRWKYLQYVQFFSVNFPTFFHFSYRFSSPRFFTSYLHTFISSKGSSSLYVPAQHVSSEFPPFKEILSDDFRESLVFFSPIPISPFKLSIYQNMKTENSPYSNFLKVHRSLDNYRIFPTRSLNSKITSDNLALYEEHVPIDEKRLSNIFQVSHFLLFNFTSICDDCSRVKILVLMFAPFFDKIWTKTIPK